MVAALLGVDLALHLGAVGLGLALGPPLEEDELTRGCALRVLETTVAQRARPAVALGALELHAPTDVDDDIGAIAIEPLAAGQTRSCVLVERFAEK